MVSTLATKPTPNHKAVTQYTTPRSPTLSDRWRIPIRTPLSIAILMFLGIGFALTHHFYYVFLDERPITELNQEWAVRIGTGLAFLTKACLIASAAMAYQQHYWSIMRAQPMSIRSIDNIMSLLSDPTCFANVNMLRDAWSCAIIALVIWCLPLTAIVPPASLTVKTWESQESLSASVPLVNWSWMAYTDIRYTSIFNDAGQETYRVVTGSVYSGTILPMAALYSNYNYTLNFPGPRYRCRALDDYTLYDNLELYSGQASYNATPPRNNNDRLNASNAIPVENQFDIWFYTPTRNFTCEMWNVTYTATFSFVNGVQSIHVQNARYDHHVLQHDVHIGDAFKNDPPELIGYAGWYVALASILTGAVYKAGVYNQTMINTRILQTALSGCPEMENAAAMGKSLGATCPGESLERALETMSENVTMSFFGGLPSVYTPVRYYTSSSELSNRTISTTPANLTISTASIVYDYKARSLLLSYFIGISCAMVIVSVGYRSLWTNGVCHTSSFSGILCKTRNKDLDTLAHGHCLGAEQLSEEIAKQKLQFGLMVDDGPLNRKNPGGVGHAAFGFPGRIAKLRKGDICG